MIARTIKPELTPTYDPKGLAEREIQEVNKMAKILLKYSGRSMECWVLAVKTATHLRSCLWHSTLPKDERDNQIPMSRWHKKRMD